MASIRKRSWASGGEARTAHGSRDYADQNGKRRLKTFATKRAADAWMVTTRHQIVIGVHTPDSTSATMADAATKWLARCEARGLERSTLEGYEQRVRLHMLPELGTLKLSRITEDRVADFRDHLLRTISRPMAQKVMISLRAILRQAKRPVDVRLERAPGRHGRRLEIGQDIPTPEQVVALLRIQPAGSAPFWRSPRWPGSGRPKFAACRGPMLISRARRSPSGSAPTNGGRSVARSLLRPGVRSPLGPQLRPYPEGMAAGLPIGRAACFLPGPGHRCHSATSAGT